MTNIGVTEHGVDTRERSETTQIDAYIGARRTNSKLYNPILSDLEDLRANQDITGLRVNTWPRTIEVNESGNQGYIDEFYEMQRWAWDHNTSLEPGFILDSRGDIVSKEKKTYLTTPVICLVERSENEIHRVAPHQSHGFVFTVNHLLDDLRDI